MFFNKIKAASLFLVISMFSALGGGCTTHLHHNKGGSPEIPAVRQPEVDERVSLGLSPEARQAHEAVMREHFEAIHQIVAALALEDFAQAQEITKSQLGFAKHREAMRRQKPEDFPPKYHDLAMAHHHAAEDLAKVIPSKNLKEILPPLERTLQACVACHRVYTR